MKLKNTNKWLHGNPWWNGKIVKETWATTHNGKDCYKLVFADESTLTGITGNQMMEWSEAIRKGEISCENDKGDSQSPDQKS